MMAACSSTENVSQNVEKAGEGSVESRGVGQMPRPVKPGVPVQPGGAGQSNVQVPTFPQKFHVQGPESDSFGFAVTQPGPIAVDVQAQGAPVLVTLQSPGGQPITQQATGNLRMNYAVTPQDVQRSQFWLVQIRLAQPMPPQQGGRAAGTVNVQYPSPNPSQVQAAIATQQQAAQRQAAQQQAQGQQAAAQVSAQMDQALEQRKAQFQQQLTNRRNALMAQVQPQLSQLQSRLSGQVRPRGVEGDNPDIPTEPADEIGTRALKPSGAPLQQAPSGVRPPMISAMQEPVSSQQALGAAGSGPPPQQVMSNPVIASLSVTQGQPGDPVMITGSGFGSSSGEIHFVIGPGLDLPAPPGAIWSDTQIFTSVPERDKVLGFNGQVYVKRTMDQQTSNLVSFRFEPSLDFRYVGRTADAQIATPGGPHGNGRDILHQNGNPFWGYRGNDHFFTNTRLKNGWVMDNGFVYIYSQRRSGAYVQEAKTNTDWPYLDVRWWMDGCFGDYESIVSYGIQVVIRGPKGVPDGLVVP
jgi:hypothetical protein